MRTFLDMFQAKGGDPQVEHSVRSEDEDILQLVAEVSGRLFACFFFCLSIFLGGEESRREHGFDYNISMSSSRELYQSWIGP